MIFWKYVRLLLFLVIQWKWILIPGPHIHITLSWTYTSKSTDIIGPKTYFEDHDNDNWWSCCSDIMWCVALGLSSLVFYSIENVIFQIINYLLSKGSIMWNIRWTIYQTKFVPLEIDRAMYLSNLHIIYSCTLYFTIYLCPFTSSIFTW